MRPGNSPLSNNIHHEGTNMNRFSRIKKLLGLKSVLAAVGLTGILLLASCAPAVDTNAIAKELTRLDDEWSKAAATKNVEKVASFYAIDAIAYPPNEPIAIGQAAAKKVWASYLNDSTFSISWKTEHAGVSKSGDLGFTAGTYEDSFRGPGGTLVTEKGKYLCTWAKQGDGTWKATHDMWNSDAK
jgi:ketosteroid isomerase-like protein